MTINERISVFFKYKGMNSAELRKLGFGTEQYLNNIMNARNKPDHEFIIALLERFPELNPRWLLLEEGNMLADSSSRYDDETEEQYRKRLIKQMEEARNYLQDLLEKIKKENTGFNMEHKQ